MNELVIPDVQQGDPSMTWFKVDDGFHSHPKVADLETGPAFAESLALWTLAGSWCADLLTDGCVPLAQLRKLVPFDAASAAAELVRVGLWTRHDGGYRFCDWADYQPTKTEIQARREKAASKVAAWRDRNRVTEPVTEPVTDDECNQVTDEDVTRSVTLPPTRPDPTRSTSYSPRASGRSPTGVRAEALRTGFISRFAQAMPGIRAPRATNPGASEPWLTIARLVTDAQVDTLLDAFFADEEPFTKDRAPTKIESQIVRLLAHGPTVNGKAQGPAKPAAPQPTSDAEAAWLSAKQAHHDAFVARAAPEVLYRLEQAEERTLAALQAYRRGAA
jgi:hypothetical protein